MSRLDFLEKYAVEGRHYDVGKEIDKTLDDPDWSVRYQAIQHPKATLEHILKGLKDEDEYVRRAAINNSNYKKFFPKWSLKRIRTAQDSFK